MIFSEFLVSIKLGVRGSDELFSVRLGIDWQAQRSGNMAESQLVTLILDFRCASSRRNRDEKFFQKTYVDDH